MGIDALDLKFQLEKKFQVEIDREEMYFLFRTVGILHEFIWQRLQGIHPAIPTLGWQLSERIIAATLALPGSRNRFWKTFERTIPEEDRRDNWDRLSRALGCPLPPLVDRPGELFPGFPEKCQKPHELADWIEEFHADRLPLFRKERKCDPPAASTQWTKAAVWDEIRGIIAKTLMVELGEITPVARLVQDLGMD